jgi:hypothetical protein
VEYVNDKGMGMVGVVLVASVSARFWVARGEVVAMEADVAGAGKTGDEDYAIVDAVICGAAAAAAAVGLVASPALALAGDSIKLLDARVAGGKLWSSGKPGGVI